jgi:hypothetical protein|nr:hypothetical protein [Leptolyngbya sp. Prado105]
LKAGSISSISCSPIPLLLNRLIPPNFLNLELLMPVGQECAIVSCVLDGDYLQLNLSEPLNSQTQWYAEALGTIEIKRESCSDDIVPPQSLDDKATSSTDEKGDDTTLPRPLPPDGKGDGTTPDGKGDDTRPPHRSSTAGISVVAVRGKGDDTTLGKGGGATTGKGDDTAGKGGDTAGKGDDTTPRKVR